METTQLDYKTNYLEKNKIDIDILKKDHQEFIKNNKLILKTQQRFKSQRNNLFNEEIIKIAFSSNQDEKCNQLIP